MKFFKKILIFIIGIILGFFGYKIYSSYGSISKYIVNGKINISGIKQELSDIEKDISDYKKYQRFDEIYSILEQDYIDQEKINSGIMIEKAIKAFVDGVDDPYTVYMDANTNSGFEQDLKGEIDFEGIGAVVSKKDYYVLVEETIKESPAFKAGILPMDRIIFVDTGSVKDLDIYQAVEKIKGPKGTKVKLIIERTKSDGTKDIIEKEVVREKLNIPSVMSKIINLDNGIKIGYFNISIIGEETDNIFRNEIINLKKDGMSGIILDLRGNGGGLLPVAVDIASHFIPEGKVIVSSKYKSLPGEVYRSEGFGDLNNYPTIVLVDELTASAGEIIAMALQEQVGAKLIGEKTFGKGTIQTLENFSDGTSIKYTIGKWYSPSNKNINGTGISPDYNVIFDMTGYIENGFDSQLEKAKKIIENMIK